MKRIKRTLGWAALIGVGLAAILNTVVIIASGLGRFNLGNSLPALLGLVMAGIGLKKLLKPEVPLLANRKLLKVFKGLLSLAMIWVAVVLFLIGYSWPGVGDDSPEWMLIHGAGLRGDQLSLTLMERLDTAVSYWQQHPDVKIIVSGGKGPDELIPESEAMALYLKQAGVPSVQLYQEKKSTSTWENIEFSMNTINRVGREQSEPLLIVTNRYHVFRAVGIAKVQGVDAVGLPADTPHSVLLGSYMREIVAVTKFLILRK